jgi:hypothetical protein
VCVCVCVFVICIYVCMYVCMYMLICVCMFGMVFPLGAILSQYNMINDNNFTSLGCLASLNWKKELQFDHLGLRIFRK